MESDIKEIARYARLYPEVTGWLSALATCAIEGNTVAIEMMDLWENDREAFIRELAVKWL